MRLLLIRHGETVDNVAGNFAGVTDSALTAHGVLQAERLGAHLAARFPTSIRAIFTSDLQRAHRTGEAVRSAVGRAASGGIVAPAAAAAAARIPLQTTPLLRERDFGPLEGAAFRACKLNVEDVAETVVSMQARARRFLVDVLLPHMRHGDGTGPDDVYVVVAHGLLLPKIYACLMDRVPRGKFTLDAALMRDPGAPPLQPWWSNTAYLELILRQLAPDGRPGGGPLRMHVLQVNCKVHLQDLRRTRGGIGSAPHDDKQRRIESYFGGKKL
ncbi:Histidine phosphatase superfamily, clade-1 [Akanthomyces lecanii RCEF 1005]|uniref:Histidine phosphatase superfamily, clade-1 n=1 Tax=Akanthomyces lecanii RCEF 1005 TaxID=1081108 RepID=A0A162KR33_CORDF|nr:Histidine phosphatase superfamily, clade-1 [Akanthomyces lecanii RCEF 1005]